MKSWLRITKRWSDDDVHQISIEVCDGSSTFKNTAYVNLDWFGDVAKDLSTFARQVHGGLYNLRAGEFGPEHADGAFHARLHFPRPGPLYISTCQQSDYVEFKDREVASEARLFLKSEPALLDRFIQELSTVARGDGDEATLESA